MFELIELIKEAEPEKQELIDVQNSRGKEYSRRAYLQGKIDAYQHILETEYPDWEDIYKFAKNIKELPKHLK